jgi:hypothetical protein
MSHDLRPERQPSVNATDSSGQCQPPHSLDAVVRELIARIEAAETREELLAIGREIAAIPLRARGDLDIRLVHAFVRLPPPELAAWLRRFRLPV